MKQPLQTHLEDSWHGYLRRNGLDIGWNHWDGRYGQDVLEKAERSWMEVCVIRDRS
jgi:hypothetical protein